MTEVPDRPHALRYADGCLTPDGEVVVCVRERHQGSAVFNEIVALPAGGGEVGILTAGHDFYAAPRVSPDGTRLAWLAWDHPDMPWDATQLWVANLVRDGNRLTVSGAVRCAGGPGESLTQPEWSGAGDLFVVSDRSEWWNVYRVGPEGLVPVHPLADEVGLPAWVFGRDRYAADDDGTIWFTYSAADGAHLVAVPRRRSRHRPAHRLSPPGAAAP